MGRLCLLFGLTLVLAGCGSSSFLGRRVDNFTAYYNTFYNARKAYERGVKSLERDNVPVDRTRYLPVFSDPDRAPRSQDFADAIKKSADVLRDHPTSKWADDALLLIGKSYFYQQNYVGAEQKFREVIDLGSDLEDEARFWLARTLIASQAYDEAAAHLQESLAREGLDRDWAAMLHLALGELYVQRANWEAAARELEIGLDDVPDKDIGARAQFLLAQVYETLGRYEDAVAAYRRVLDYNPLYELAYAARYSAIRVEGLYLDPEAALRALRKMERDDKHYAYRADLAFLRGRIYQAMGRGEEARALYRDLLYSEDRSLDISRIRGPIHYALGELYRDYYEDFVRAAAYFDTAAVALRTSSGTTASRRGTGPVVTENPDAYAAEAILDAQLLKERFGSYADVYREVARMDSLLTLGQMPEEAFQHYILELRRQRAREQEAQRRLREQQQIEQRFRGQTSSVNTTGGTTSGKQVDTPAPSDDADAGFLYHRDPVRLQEARARFISRWGDRPRVPNWRRLEAISRQVSEDGPDALATQTDVVPDEAGGEVLPEIDISGVPRDPAAQERMRAARAMARYELANVLFLAIERPDSAAVWYRRVIEEDTDQPVAQRALYALAEVQRALGDEETAQRLYEQVLANYPDTDFAERVRERLGRQDNRTVRRDTLALAEAAYEQAYQAWRHGAYEAALNDMVRVAGTYAGTDVAPRALLAAGAIYTEWSRRDSLDLLAPLPLSVPDSLLDRAGLTRVAARPIILPAPNNGVPPKAGAPDKTGIPPKKNVAAANVPVKRRPGEAGPPQPGVPAPVQAGVPADTTGTTEPAAISLTTLYQALASYHPGTPYADQARRVLAALEAIREAREAEETAADSVRASPASDSLQVLAGEAVTPDSLNTRHGADLDAGAAGMPVKTPPNVAAAPGEVSDTTTTARPDADLFDLLDEADDEDRPVYDVEDVDAPPVPTGGMERLVRILQSAIVGLRVDSLEAVVVRFVVDEEGRVAQTEIDPSLEAGREALLRQRLLPIRFSPGTLRGQPVRVRMEVTLPLGPR
ncbi:MAG: hypothetical protein KatS3mg042_0334 [Rhodothermaceae bacterium]|nr:MAG: hypothetical protein KatS3mg042_0334 [Rhodothermaceae bacterium]